MVYSPPFAVRLESSSRLRLRHPAYHTMPTDCAARRSCTSWRMSMMRTTMRSAQKETHGWKHPRRPPTRSRAIPLQPAEAPCTNTAIVDRLLVVLMERMRGRARALMLTSLPRGWRQCSHPTTPSTPTSLNPSGSPFRRGTHLMGEGAGGSTDLRPLCLCLVVLVVLV